jgi:hypothetical protein
VLGLFHKDEIAAGTPNKGQCPRLIEISVYHFPGMDSEYTTGAAPLAPGEPPAPYDQIILFGDSLTQNSFDPEIGYAYGAALHHG